MNEKNALELLSEACAVLREDIDAERAEQRLEALLEILREVMVQPESATQADVRAALLAVITERDRLRAVIDEVKLERDKLKANAELCALSPIDALQGELVHIKKQRDELARACALMRDEAGEVADLLGLDGPRSGELPELGEIPTSISALQNDRDHWRDLSHDEYKEALRNARMNKGVSVQGELGAIAELLELEEPDEGEIAEAIEELQRIASDRGLQVAAVREGADQLRETLRGVATQLGIGDTDQWGALVPMIRTLQEELDTATGELSDALSANDVMRDELDAANRAVEDAASALDSRAAAVNMKNVETLQEVVSLATESAPDTAPAPDQAHDLDDLRLTIEGVQAEVRGLRAELRAAEGGPVEVDGDALKSWLVENWEELRRCPKGDTSDEDDWSPLTDYRNWESHGNSPGLVLHCLRKYVAYQQAKAELARINGSVSFEVPRCSVICDVIEFGGLELLRDCDKVNELEGEALRGISGPVRVVITVTPIDGGGK